MNLKPPPLIILILLLVVFVFVGVSFLFPKSAPQKTLPALQEPQFLEGTFSQSQGLQELPQEPIELSIQGAKEGKTIELSWDESKVRVFHIVLLNTKWQAVWLLSSVGALPEKDADIKRENVSSFILSGYEIGDVVEGFQALGEQQEFTLDLEQQYYLQILGFAQDDQTIAVNKKFTFTASCLPPNCK